MLLLKSMDRLRLRIAIFLAVHLFIPFLFILHNLNTSYADSTRDDQFPDSTGTQNDGGQNVAAVVKETRNKLAKVYGPPSPTGSDEEIVMSSPKKIGKVTPPSAEIPAKKVPDQATLELEAKKVMDEEVEEQKARKGKETQETKTLEAKLVEEQKKIKQEVTKPESAPIPSKQAKKNNDLRIDAKDQTAELLKAQKKEKKHYGMTLDELSQQWSALGDKSSASKSRIIYKDLSKQEKKLVKIKVKAERNQAKERMPIIDRGYFNEAINKDTVIAQENFVIGEKKSLEESVQRAKDVSLQMKLSTEKDKAAKWRTLKAFRELNTALNFEETYKIGSLTGTATMGSGFTSNAQRLNFKQPVFHGGNLWNTFRQEAASWKASKEDLEKTSAKLVLDVAQAYLNYSKALSLFQTKSALAVKAETFKMHNEEKKKVGAVSEIEYLNTDSLIGEINADLQTAYQELALAQVDLSKFLKTPKNQVINVDPIDSLKDRIISTSGGNIQVSRMINPEQPTAVDNELEGLINRAYRNRPDLKLEEFKFMSNRYKTKAMYGKFLPQADFIIEFGELAEAYKAIDKTPPYHDEFKVGVEVSQNFFGSNFKYGFDSTQTAPNVSAFNGGSGTRINTNKFTVGLLDSMQQFVDVKEARAQMVEQMVELQEKENEVIKDVKETYYGYHKALIHMDSAIKKMLHKERVAKLKSYQLEKN
ncbi:MAG: TolC family protein, partial [Candidatus Omnitrophica bacterium]|nr:TolC family protein [Candidatus Omnitrophota bacterium]